MLSLTPPKKPWRSHWQRLPAISIERKLSTEKVMTADRWYSPKLGILVLSSVQKVIFRGEETEHYHVSISVLPTPKTPFRRPTDEEAQDVLLEFGLLGAEEDNHEPGKARHFWKDTRLLHSQAQQECECKDDEETVVESDGHRWQRPKEKVAKKWEVWLNGALVDHAEYEEPKDEAHVREDLVEGCAFNPAIELRVSRETEEAATLEKIAKTPDLGEAIREERRQKGLCLRCGAQPPRDGQTYCSRNCEEYDAPG